MALGDFNIDLINNIWSNSWSLEPSLQIHDSDFLKYEIDDLKQSMKWWKLPSSKREIRELIEQKEGELKLLKLKS